MKIAVVFSGVPRELDRSSWYFKEWMFSGYDVDIFSYVWKLDEYLKLDQIYNHKVLQYNQPIDFFATYPRTNVNVYSHWYGLQNACRNFKNYVDVNRVKYDLVVRTRHDIALYHKVDFTRLDPGLLNVADCHWPGREIFDDNLLITGQDNYFKIYSKIYDWYEQRNTEHQFYDVPEQKLYNYLASLGMIEQVRRNSNLDFILTRGLR